MSFTPSLKTTLALSLMLLATRLATAGTYNQVLNIGDPAPAWEILPGVDGQPHSLAELKDKPVVVVVFTCNSCPVAVEYEDRINAFAKQHAGPDGKVALVAINCNKLEADLLPAMQARAKAKGFVFPYLSDVSQKTGRAYGAFRTPEFFVLDRDRKVVYMGAMDGFGETAGTNYLEAAVTAALAGKTPETTETIARGCAIRYARERRKR
jgi:peroxiredoxin